MVGRWVRGIGAAVCGMMLAGAGYGQSRAIVDYLSDYGRPVQVAPDSTVHALVGNVIFHHNGAILTCDSALMHNSRYIECFGNVIINRDSTYVYGERADFDGETNIARVYDLIIKTVDGDMTMYSFDLEFNSLTNIGRYLKGGTISQKDNLMESQEGLYDANERVAIFSRDVVLKNEEYLIETDSLGYNMDSEVATFYRPAKIWNKDGDFLSADRGSYDRANDTYTFTENSYILTADQEIWADSLTYLKTAGHVFMFNNVQIHDQVQRSFLFGDHGIYWTEDQQALLTDNPSSIFYEEKEGQDSLYMRADSMLLFSLQPGMDENDAAARMLGRSGRGEQHDSVRMAIQEENPIDRSEWNPVDSAAIWSNERFGSPADSLARPVPEVTTEAESDDGSPPDGESEAGSEEEMVVTDDLLSDSVIEKETIPDILPVPVDEQVLLPTVDSLPPGPVIEPDEGEDEEITAEEEEKPLTARQQRRQKRREDRLERREQQMRAYLEEAGLLAPKADSLDSLALAPIDSLALLPEISIPADTIERDSVQRVIRAYRNVKIFREDLQAICDSLVAYSLDSTAHMYRAPVLWNNNSQITSDVMHFFSANEELLRAEFEVKPIMIEWVVDSLYNQVKGDRMMAHFRENEVIRFDVLDNAQAYYYMTEKEELKGFLVTASKDMYFRFDSSELRYIAPIEQITWTLYPMDKIPASQPQRMDIFEWKEALRPRSKYDVWDRRLRPTQREENSSLEQPQFQLTRDIDELRKDFVKRNVWRDRNDLIRIDPSYFNNQGY